MTTLAIRKKLHSYIDTIPEHSLSAIEPLLAFLAEEEYWKPVIETDLTDAERAIIAAGEKEFREHPESFVTLTELKKRLGRT
jgi:hypothetical protein